MLRKLFAGLIVAGLLAACATTQGPEAPVEDRSAVGAGGPGATTAGVGSGAPSGMPGAGAAPSQAQPGGPGGPVDPLKDPANPLSKRSVYFDFDSYAVKDEFRSLIEVHGQYLIQNRGARMRIEGHTDERGSREYNIALGQRRAEAVKRMLQALGVAEDQVETVSFGKEKPRNLGHDEAAWAENRRADIAYAGE